MSSNKLIIVVILIAVVVSSCIGGGVALWMNWESLFPSAPAPNPKPSSGKPPGPSGTQGGTPGGSTSGTPSGSTGVNGLPSGEFRIRLVDFGDAYFEMQGTGNGATITVKPLNTSSNNQIWSADSNAYIKNKATGLYLTIDIDDNLQQIDSVNGWGDYYAGKNGKQIWKYDPTKQYLSALNHNLEWSNWNLEGSGRTPIGKAQVVVYDDPGNGRQKVELISV
jgi:hypothetical protein